MLVLSRTLTESIRIGERVTVTVLEVRQGRVRLGIDAPAAVRIQREEAWLKRLDSDLAPSGSCDCVSGMCQA